MSSSRFLNPTTPGGLLSPGLGGLTATEQLTVQNIANGTYFVENEVPSGTVNGVDDGQGNISGNTVFTTANTVNPTSSIQVYLNGSRVKGGGVDYTFSSTNTITFVTAPLTGSILLVNYRRQP